MYHSKIIGCIQRVYVLSCISEINFQSLWLKTHDINDCGFSPILSTYLLLNRPPNNAPMELPNGLSPSSFLLVKSKAWDKVQGFWFESSYYKPFFGFP